MAKVRRSASFATAACLLLTVALGPVSGSATAASASPLAPAPWAQIPGEDDLEIPSEESPEGDLPVAPPTTEAGEDQEQGVGDDPTGDEADVVGDGSDETDGSDGSVDAENRRILLIILGLVAVAIALSLLTIRYWRQTKPVPLPVEDPVDGYLDGDPVDDLTDDPEAELFGAIRAREPRTTRIPAVHDPVVEDGGAGFDDEVADRGDDADGDDDPYADLFEPVVQPPRRSRRAVAGADHAEVDDLWVPRGTGEHDRLDVDETPSISKPTSDQRAAAFDADRHR